MIQRIYMKQIESDKMEIEDSHKTYRIPHVLEQFVGRFGHDQRYKLP